MKQQTFASGDFERYRKPTRREQFPAEMDKVVPWTALCTLIELFYPKAGNGRPPVGVERMLRIYFLQYWLNLLDPAVEEALYESRSMCCCLGIDLGWEPVPDETAILNFRHLLERHHLGERLFQAVGGYLRDRGLRITSGAIVDSRIISVPCSTKNKDQARDPEIHQTKKGNPWYFGTKARSGVGSKTKQIHSVAATAHLVHDSQVLEELLHGEETRVGGDSAYSGQMASGAKDITHEKGGRNRLLDEAARARNRTKSRIRVKMEHVFGVIMRVFGFTKVRYRGLAKNAHALFVLCALTNLSLARRPLRCQT